MKITAKLLVAVFVAAAIVSCGGAPTAPSGGEPADTQDSYRIGLVLPDLSNQIINAIKLGAEAEAERMGNVEIITSASYVPEEQVQGMENLIAMQADLIAFDTIDSGAFTPAVIKANEAGIPLIAFLSGPESGDLVSFIATPSNAHDVGATVGRWMAEALDNKGTVAIIDGMPATEASRMYTNGFVSGLYEGAAQIDIRTSQPTNYDREVALNVTSDVLTANPELDGMYGVIDDVAMGAYEALEASGREDEVLVAGVNGTCEALSSILKGELDFTVMWFMPELGAKIVQTAVKVLDGEEVPEEIPAPTYGIDTATAQAILAGEAEAPDGLNDAVLERLREAEAGCQ